MSTEYSVFLVMVFLAVFLLARSLIVPTFGTEARTAKRLRGPIKGVVESLDPASSSLLRDRFLEDLSPLDRWLQQFPGIEAVTVLIRQSGRKTTVTRLLVVGATLGMGVGLVTLLLTHMLLVALVAGALASVMPVLMIRRHRDKRIDRFEEQLPEALDVMGRSLRAGHPFSEALKLVADEQADPLAGEFKTTFSDINYGMSTKTAFYSLLERVPSMSLMAVVTAVQVQRETGGNMAEIMDKLAAVIRSRFRFQRKVRTLSAEARLSAWVLALVPFVLCGILAITSPNYLPMLAKDPTGRTLIMIAFGAMIVGILWMRRIIRIEV